MELAVFQAGFSKLRGLLELFHQHLTKSRWLLFLLAVFGGAAGEPLLLDLLAFEARVLGNYPLLLEKEFNVEEKKIELKKLESSAWLPRFEFDFGMGPAPGIKNMADTNFLRDSSGINKSSWVLRDSREFDWTSWGTFFGMEMSVIQPLNIFRYRAGHRAGTLNVSISEEEKYKSAMEVSVEAQEIYFGWLYAQTMLRETTQAMADLDKAEKKLEKLLDEESETIDQKDLLKLKSSRYTLEKNHQTAITGLQRARLGSNFYLFLPDSLEFSPADSILALHPFPMSSRDTLRLWLIQQHPDLKRLALGLEARKELLQVAKGEFGPEIFLFGKFKYTKAWASDRNIGSSDAFAVDPLNELDGAAGLGVRVRLNFWTKIQNYKSKELELKRLERTEVYAVRGLMLKLEEAMVRYEEGQNRVESASYSLRAAEALLKGSAMDYDLDPSTASELMSSYRTALTARRDYYEALFQTNMAGAKVVQAGGWTLSDYLSKVNFKR